MEPRLEDMGKPIGVADYQLIVPKEKLQKVLADKIKAFSEDFDLAERMANRHIPMTMEDWAKRIDIILEAGGDAVLHDAEKITPSSAYVYFSISATKNIAGDICNTEKNSNFVLGGYIMKVTL